MSLILCLDPSGEAAVAGPTEEVQFGPVLVQDANGALVERHVRSVKLHAAIVNGVSYSYGYFVPRRVLTLDSETCAACCEARSVTEVRGMSLCADCAIDARGGGA